MTDRDQDERRDPTDETPPEEQAGADAPDAPDTPPAGPTPATWAGRQRSSDEDADQRDQPSAEEQDEAGESADAEQGEEGEDTDEDGGPDTAERIAQDTVETDTLALADREAAREAALAGLRARAADHATKHGTEAITSPPPKKGEAKGADTKGDGHQPAAAPPPVKPPVAAVTDAEDKPPRRGMWPRFVAGSLLIIAAMATATAVSLFFFINGVLAEFHGVPAGVQNELTVPHPGQPQTILIIGSDKRPQDQAIGARSDTTILLRIASDQITVLSIPRDLKVNIPGHGIDKFNAAYTIGGEKKTLQVVKQLTGITDINHIVNVDFTGFASAVNAIGCVYVDVDHHYYHSNYGLPASEQYAEIDIDAGYQRMCGGKALSYVRYRHDDNDLVRSARQQEFLRELRQELPASRILAEYDQLKNTLAKYVTLDVQKAGDLLSLAQLIVSANGAPVVQVHFPANLGGPTAAYVTASKPAIKAAVAKFEGVNPEPVPGETTTASSSNGGGGGSKPNGGSKSGGSSAPAPAPTLIDVSSTAQQAAATLEAAKTEGGSRIIHFPLYYPTRLAPDSELLTQDPGDTRAFLIDGPGDDVYHGYKFVAQMPTDGYTAYYGVSGTDWKDPPILDNPDETKTLDGRDYLLSWDGPQLRLIGWKTDQGSYWVDNTLLNALTPGQMFAIAESMRKYTG